MKHVFCISAYGESPYLEDCIRSLLSQKDRSEVLICTSTPGPFLSQISDRYEIPVFVRDGESSLKEDWNYCLQVAADRGASLVTIAHQDDIYDPAFAGKVKQAFQKGNKKYKKDGRYFTLEDDTGDTAVVCTRCRNINGLDEPAPGTAEKVKRLLRWPLSVNGLNKTAFGKRMALSLGNSIPCPTCTYNLNLCGTSIFNTDYRFVIDWAALAELSRRPVRFVCIEEPLVDIRIHDGAETARTMKEGLRQKEEQEMFEQFHGKLGARLFEHFYKKSSNVYVKEKEQKHL